MDTDLKDLDLYGILEIQQSATEKEVITIFNCLRIFEIY